MTPAVRRAAPVVALLCAAVPAGAAERNVYLGSFDRLRVQGPFDVRVHTGAAPGARLEGDRAAIDVVELQSDGATLVVRSPIGRWQERPAAARTVPIVVRLTTPVLAAVSVSGAGKVAVDAVKAARIDLAVTGAGNVAVAAATGDALVAQVIGGGGVAVAGRVGTARLATNGPGTIDAAGLDVGDLVVRLDGPGATRARARYTASIVDTGIGTVDVAGSPRCTVRADAGGPVSCGGAGGGAR